MEEQPAVTSRHVAKGVGTTLLARIGGLIEVVSQPLYVWMFGLASFGLYTVLWAAINLFENIFDQVISVNVRGTANVGRSALHGFRRQGGGTLIVVGSLLGLALLLL